MRYSLQHYNVHFRNVSELMDLAKSRHVKAKEGANKPMMRQTKARSRGATPALTDMSGKSAFSATSESDLRAGIKTPSAQFNEQMFHNTTSNM